MVKNNHRKLIKSDQRISIEVPQPYKLSATVPDTETDKQISKFCVFKL